MTIEKALTQLNSLMKDRESFCHRDVFDDMFLQDIEALKVGISALEKQVPKKVIWENEKNSKTYLFSWAYCPNCGSDMCDKHNEEFQFCPDCGQALDWSEEEEECITIW